MLTEKQSQVLQLIIDRQAIDGVTPSYDEMKDVLGLASKSGIHRLITGLETRGYIRRLPSKARAIEVLWGPQIAPPESMPSSDRELLTLVLGYTDTSTLPGFLRDALREFYGEVRNG